jgi:Tol biopolymer transport system component
MKPFGLFLIAAVLGWGDEPNRIFFSRLVYRQQSLYISLADGSAEHSLAPSSGSDYNPAWSPDGQWIAFSSERNGSADLYRVKPDGSGLERLTDHPAYDDQAAFSPDGTQLVFVTTRAAGNTDLWILDVRTRKARPLTSGADGDFRPAWSPDGTWIAFSSDRGSPARNLNGRWERLQLLEVFVIRPDGSGLKRITQTGNFCGSPRWTRDSQRLVAYCMTAEETYTFRNSLTFPPGSKTRLVSIDVVSGEMSDLAEAFAPAVRISPVILPYGEVAYIRVGDSGGVFYGLGKPGPAGSIQSASWSPDGTRVVYARRERSPTRSQFKKTWSRNPQYELFSSVTEWLPSFHPSGKRFVAMNTSGPGPYGLDLIETSTSASRLLFQDEKKDVVSAQWSPKGDAILFGLAVFDGVRFEGQVAMVNPAGSDLHEITSGANTNGHPSFSPDGKRFVYRTTGPEGQGLRIKNLEGNSVTPLTTEYDSFPSWSPRGDLITFTRRVEGDFEIYTIRPDGTNARRLTNSPGNDSHSAWSPNGEWIVFTSARMGFKDEVMYTPSPQPYGELFVMRKDGTRIQQLTDDQWEDGGPAWQPSGRDRTPK